jgi:hypothetical protein
MGLMPDEEPGLGKMIERSRKLAARFGACLARPDPAPDFGHILAVLSDITRMFKQLVAEVLFDVRGANGKPGDAVNDVDGEVISIEPVEYGHVEWRRGGTLLLEAMKSELFGVLVRGGSVRGVFSGNLHGSFPFIGGRELNA